MKLPIDVKAVVEAATDLEGARSTPVSVSVLIDDTAPGDLAAHVRKAFVGESSHARVTVGYFDGASTSPSENDDMAVIVAGTAEDVGKRAHDIRAAGVPVMVVASAPSLVADMADAFGWPIPEGDLISPKEPELALADGKAQAVHAAHAEVGADVLIEIDDAAAASLDERMGEWVVEACRDKRLALALAFPFVRRPLSKEAVSATSMQNAGVGLVAIIPGADMPIMTLNQAKMLLQIAAAYGQPMTVARAKELAAIVAGGVACRGVARNVVGLVPGAGWVVKAGIGYAGTQAMGRAAIEYFENGGNISGLAGVVSKATEKVTEAAGAAASTPAGAAVVSAVKSGLKTGAKKLRPGKRS